MANSGLTAWCVALGLVKGRGRERGRGRGGEGGGGEKEGSVVVKGDCGGAYERDCADEYDRMTSRYWQMISQLFSPSTDRSRELFASFPSFFHLFLSREREEERERERRIFCEFVGRNVYNLFAVQRRGPCLMIPLIGMNSTKFVWM